MATPAPAAIAQALFKETIKGSNNSDDGSNTNSLNEALATIKKTLSVYNIEATTLCRSTAVRELVKQVQQDQDTTNKYMFRQDTDKLQYMFCTRCMSMEAPDTAYACPVVCFKIVTKNKVCGEIKVEEVYPHNIHCCSNQSKEKLKDSMESKNGGTGYKTVSFPTEEVLGGTLDNLISTVHEDVWENAKNHVGM